MNKMEPYFQIVPVDVITIILSYVDSIGLRSIIETNQDLFENIRWEVTFNLRYKSYNKENTYRLYLKYLEMEKIKDELQLSETLKELFDLSFLNLSHHDFMIIPLEIRSLANLRILNFCNNKIRSIPEEIGNLINLKELFLNNNYIEKVPDKLFDLTNLKKLSLSDNCLRHLEITNIKMQLSQMRIIAYLANNIIN